MKCTHCGVEFVGSETFHVWCPTKGAPKPVEIRPVLSARVEHVHVPVHARPTKDDGSEWIASFYVPGRGGEYCEHGKTADEAVAALQKTMERAQDRWLERLRKEQAGG